MKELIIVLLFGHSLAANCQQCVVTSTRENIVYVGISNSLDVAVDGCSCKDIVLSTNSGRLERGSTPCNYLLYPNKPGKIELVVSDIKGTKRKVISSVNFRAKNIPAPDAYIAGKNGGEISKNILKIQIAPYAKLNGHFCMDIAYCIEGFRTTIFRGEEVLFTEKCIGRLFSDTIKDAFQRVETNDYLIISDIKYTLPNGLHGKLKPIEFEIVD